MTSAPKSAMTVVATGPAMKLAASITRRPSRKRLTRETAGRPPGRLPGCCSLESRLALRRPVLLVGGEYRRAAGGRGRPVEHVGHFLPGLVVRHRAVLLQRRLVLVDLVEVVDAFVLLILQDVEAVAAGLVALGAERVHLDGLEEPRLA